MTAEKQFDISIIGTVGLPPCYGGFETLAAQLTCRIAAQYRIQVFCTGHRYPDSVSRPKEWNGAFLRYVDWSANGWQSIPYDIVSLWLSARRSRVLLVLGVSGCLILPLIRFFWPSTRIVTNVDGLEWKRSKWGFLARTFLRLSEWFAVHFSHAVVSDNQGIYDYISQKYGTNSYLIAYGGDQDTEIGYTSVPVPVDTRFDSGSYHLALCRIEPENNIEAILEAFKNSPEKSLVFVGNWDVSEFAKVMRSRFGSLPNIELKDPIYSLNHLKSLRKSARAYIHGHSSGGTNPSLVEAMHSGMAVMAFDINYNRHTTHNKAIYWQDTDTLAMSLCSTPNQDFARVASNMRDIAQSHYTWTLVANQYLGVLFPTD